MIYILTEEALQIRESTYSNCYLRLWF